MMWTLALLLGITALFVTKLIGRIVAQIKRPAYPSDGLIDQVLPPVGLWLQINNLIMVLPILKILRHQYFAYLKLLN